MFACFINSLPSGENDSFVSYIAVLTDVDYTEYRYQGRGDHMFGKKLKERFVFNAPVTLVFSIVCVIAFLLDGITDGKSTISLFSVYRAPLSHPLTWLRCFFHIFGHVDWAHLSGNIMYLLILGPMLEEKYGTLNIIVVIAAAAFFTGVINMIFFPQVMLFGASGVVFAFILLSSITSSGDGRIPVTFLLVALFYLGGQIYDGLFVTDHISQLAHIIGGIVGTGMGFLLNRKKSTANL